MTSYFRIGLNRGFGLALLAGVATLVLAGCESADKEPVDKVVTDDPLYGTEDPVIEDTAGKYPNVELNPAELCQASGVVGCTYEFDQGQVAVGKQAKVALTIVNTGERSLNVKEIELANYSVASGAEEDSPVFSLDFSSASAYQQKVDNEYANYWVAPVGKGVPGISETLVFELLYVRPADDLLRTADLLITTDAANQPKLLVRLSTAKGFPKIQVSPDWVDFKQVTAGEVPEEKVNIMNTGAADLMITGFKLNGSEFYTLLVQGTEYPVSGQTAEGITFEDAVVVEPGSATFFKVRFEPLDDKPATAKLIIYGNDPERAGGSEVKISGNENVPCIAVNPASVSFGGKEPGEVAVVPVEVVACGEAPLELYEIHIEPGSSQDFAVDLDSLEHEPLAGDPLIVPIGGTVTFNVTFTPDVENPLTEDGNMILDVGALIIKNNSFDGEKRVDLSGAGTHQICPTAIVKSGEGDEVIPQTVIHLFGDESYATSGAIQKWQWEVVQPAGHQGVFVPSSSFPNPTFEANIQGLYTFYLTVYDQANTPSCFPGVYEVAVITDEAIHIELLWHTPEDPDETDTGPEAGSDLDLHFKHPWAAGPDLDADGAPDGWFDIPFDCFWFNAHPNWGSYDPAIKDDPGLDRDDTDGAGPENVNIDIPEVATTYCVGVHYWDDHGYGAAFATVRIYIYAQLVFEVSDVMLMDLDMWDVACIEWPSGKVTLVTDPSGNYKITPDYSNPYFFH